MSSYAVLWSEPAQPIRSGKLELEPAALRFEGSSGGTQSVPLVHRVAYDEIESVHVGRGRPERLAGRPSLVLDLGGGGSLRIGSVEGPGILGELAELLERLKPSAAGR